MTTDTLAQLNGRSFPIRAAQVITDVLSPAVLVAGLLLAVSGHSAHTVTQAVTVGLVAAAAASIIPITYILRGVRRGRWTDRHVTVREQRKLPLLVCFGSTLIGAVVLYTIGAPRELVALIFSMVASLALAWPITMLLHWKISVHALVAAGAAVALAVVFGGWMLAVMGPAAVAVCWSRTKLRDHTIAQVVGGAIVGIAATGVLFPALISLA